MDYTKLIKEYDREIKTLENTLAKEKANLINLKPFQLMEANRRISILKSMICDLKTSKGILEERNN